MPTLTDIRALVEAGTPPDPDTWDAALAEDQALRARPSPEALQSLQAEATAAKDALAALQANHDALQAHATALVGTHDQTLAAHAEAIAKLKATYALAHQVPEQLLAGASVAELDASLASARTVVAQIAEQIRNQTASKIPNGAPGRTPPNYDDLTPLEKIRQGLAHRNNT